MAPAYRAVGANGYRTSGNPSFSPHPVVPASAVAGDILILFVTADRNDMTTPAGWTRGPAWTPADNGSVAIWSTWFYKVAGLGDPGASVTCTFAGNVIGMAQISAWSGATSFGPYSVGTGSGSGAGSANITGVSVTPNTDDSLLVFLGGFRANGSATPPAGMTERYDTTRSSPPYTQESSSEVRADQTPTGNRVGTANVSTAPTVGFLLSLNANTPSQSTDFVGVIPI